MQLTQPQRPTAYRNFGLDVIRAAAIVLVLISHGRLLLGEPWATRLDVVPWGLLGVELFFVLSGFLIGQILCRELIDQPSWATIKRFWSRRWLRTLPLYYVVLVAVMMRSGNFPWSHFVFLQNFDGDAIKFLPVSWSLAVEEWFYLLLPLALWVGLRRKQALPRNRAVRNLGRTILTLVALVLISRTLYVTARHPEFDFGVRKYIPVRFDSMLVGVWLAYLKLYKQSYFTALSRGWLALTALLATLAMTLYYAYLGSQNAMIHNGFAQTLGFLLMSTCMGLFIPWLSTRAAVSSHALWNRLISVTSLYSYSLYLTHAEWLGPVQNWHLSPLQAVGVWTALCYFTAMVLYYGLERPVLRWRDRYFP